MKYICLINTNSKNKPKVILKRKLFFVSRIRFSFLVGYLGKSSKDSSDKTISYKKSRINSNLKREDSNLNKIPWKCHLQLSSKILIITSYTPLLKKLLKPSLCQTKTIHNHIGDSKSKLLQKTITNKKSKSQISKFTFNIQPN